MRFVDVVHLCPGEEGEVSFPWDRVWAFDPHAVAAYRAYLEKTYGGDRARLNADWGSAYAGIGDILPPGDYRPDREHWVFTDFYRLGMLRSCVFLADAVRAVFTPRHWLWMTHSIGGYPQRFNAARYPLFCSTPRTWGGSAASTMPRPRRWTGKARRTSSICRA